MCMRAWVLQLMFCVILRALEAHGVPVPPAGAKQKDNAIKALLRATKKRRQPDSGSDGDGAGTTADGTREVE
eukprot:2441470-Pleurochrysis_carterae.AAC.1